jgi:hypothetical protein
VVSCFIFLMLSWHASAAPPELVELREGVRAMASSKSCVNCHMPGQPGALQRILDVYNLRNTFWSATLDAQRLTKFKDRMQDVLTSKTDMKLIETFVQKELEFRRSNPDELPRDIERNRRERALNELGILRLPE